MLVPWANLPRVVLEILNSLELDILDMPSDEDVEGGVIKFPLFNKPRTIIVRDMCEHYGMKNEGEHTYFVKFLKDMDRFRKLLRDKKSF